MGVPLKQVSSPPKYILQQINQPSIKTRSYTVTSLMAMTSSNVNGLTSANITTILADPMLANVILGAGTGAVNTWNFAQFGAISKEAMSGFGINITKLSVLQLCALTPTQISGLSALQINEIVGNAALANVILLAGGG